jgi:hypothetical protein
MIQLVAPMEAQAGRAGVDVQLVIAAPLLLSVVGATNIAVPTFPVVPVAAT